MTLLTDVKARSIIPGTPAIAHGGVTGLTLLPSATRKGEGKWVLRYVSPVTGKRRNAGLGTYPQVGIALAGKLAREMREQIAIRQDPLVNKAGEAAKPEMPTFQQAAEQVHTEMKPGWRNVKHAQQWINTLVDYALPKIGSMPMDQLQPRHIADVLRPIWLEKAETASRVKQRLHAVMAWGWAHGFNQANPVDVVNHLLPLQPSKTIRQEHQPAMPWPEVPKFVAAELASAGELDVTRRTLLFLILTAARSGEVRAMTWDEVDLSNGVWAVPAERMKAQQIHRVPLSEQALTLLKAQAGRHAELVFPSIRARTVLSDMTLTALLRRLETPSDTKDRVATAHGFRSSFRDWSSEKGYARDLAERALAHTLKSQVEAAYHRTDLLEQRRPMMQAWGDFVCPQAEKNASQSS
ncbi:TPA: tyrosine-type recombinase/integrase [Stenotrophomonas maltophilia]|uniref:tyrosine-type recombinase/integrase n=1 Tax=Stenotrophomonas maltophilia TaxID=40324 RepID=UPI0018D3DB3E|nr:site-specific integrase [Stenotrophomonas maltophilia]MBH1753070.1 tyrosine-type recombinase/integrase [Stenotrophomonas maltophilia]MBH1811279.1 tyrosine-type recombinase/integrase [Stenotrophomonas maltophilia]MBS6053627.1 tyrosine-type recombinase/integrase [Stenotrophomonas maltophilia]HEL4404172.1 tyrosine-type recombinase/integrase [Stenotrophomonas maltophilia]HEL4809888.1 tyrosine-type recombinase/integrase [Stenotrophomonas maltophilia]